MEYQPRKWTVIISAMATLGAGEHYAFTMPMVLLKDLLLSSRLDSFDIRMVQRSDFPTK